MSLIPFSHWKAKTAGVSGISTDQLICHLDAGDPNSYPGTGNTWTDLSTGNTTAALNGNMSLVWNNNGYFAFQANANGWADIGLQGIDSTTPVLTVEMWIRPYTTTSGGMFFGFNIYDLYHTTDYLGYNTSGGDIYGMDSYHRFNENGWFGQWQHVVCVMNQTTVYTNNKIYLNGRAFNGMSQKTGSELPNGRSFSNGLMRINSWRNDTNYPMNFDNAIFRVYKKELTESEVIENFNTEYTRFGVPALKNFIRSGCRVYIDFEGVSQWYASSGSYVKDFSPSMGWGSLSGGVSWQDNGTGGYMEFRNTTNREVALNKTAGNLGIFYGSFSTVTVVKYSDVVALNYIFGSNDPFVSQQNVNLYLINRGFVQNHNHGADVNTNTAQLLNNNTWYHIVSTYNYDTYRINIYINGVLVIADAHQERVIGNQWYYLARVNGLTYNLDMGLFMCYNRLLSQAEITETFNNQRTRFGI